MRRVLEFYKSLDGRCPVEDFLNSLVPKDARKVTWGLALLEDLEIIPGTYLRKIVNAEGIWEYRMQSGTNVYRIFCFFSENSTIVLTHGFTKKSQKTPKAEIEKAKIYKRSYLSRRTHYE